MKTKHEVLQAHLDEWLACKGDKKKRGIIIKKLSSLLDMHPKSIGRSMKRLQLKSKTKKQSNNIGRPRYYDIQVDNALYKIWEQIRLTCAYDVFSSKLSRGKASGN